MEGPTKINIRIIKTEKKKFNTYKSVGFSLLAGLITAGLFSATFFAFATPPTSPYTPGQTTDPNCSPNPSSPNYKANCTVVAPLTSITGQDLSTANNSTSNFTTLSAVAGVGYLTSSSTLNPANISGYPNDVTKFLAGNGTWVVPGIFSQWTTSGGNIYYNSGNVGIGTTSPTRKLEIVDNVNLQPLRISGSATDTGLSINNTATGGRAYALYSSGSGSSIGSGNFTIFDENAALGRFTINSSGNVGIGTANPQYKLDVNGDVNITGAFRVNGTPISGGSSLWTNDSHYNLFSIYAGNGTMTGYDNFFTGVNAGHSNTTGIYNNFLGYEAGYLNTSGSENNFLGYNAGSNNTSGSNNDFFGQWAGFSNTTGFNNNFLGLYAGYKNTTGSQNNFFGQWAGYSNTTGTNNNFIGNQAGYYNTTGTTNNFLGYDAGYSNTTGSGNLFLGNNAGYNETGSNKLYIANASGAPLIGGDFSTGKVTFNGAYTFPASAGTSGQSLTLTDNSGTLSWASVSNSPFNYDATHQVIYSTDAVEPSSSVNSFVVGQGAGNGTSGSNYINLLGESAGANDTGIGYSNFMGFQAGASVSYSSSSNFFGYQAGDSATNSGSSNFIGTNAGDGADSSGSSNFLGNAAGYGAHGSSGSNFIGPSAGSGAYGTIDSNFFGDNAGNAANGSSDSNFLGYQAGYGASNSYQSNFFGYQAGGGNPTGNDGSSYDNFIGMYAGTNNKGGKYNNFIGYQAGINNVAGSDDIFIGDNAGAGNVGSNNTIAIGNNAGVTYNGGGLGADMENIFMGTLAGAGQGATSTGMENNFIGDHAGFQNTSGNNNNFIGNGTGYSNTTGAANVFIGEQTGYNNTSGNNNNFIGNAAGGQNVSGNYNNYLGFQAGYWNNGYGNVFIGTYAGSNQTSTNNSLFIDNTNRGGPTADMTRSLIYGTFASAPTSQQLTVNGSLILGGGFTSYPGTSTEGQLYYNTTSHSLNLYNGTSWVNLNGSSSLRFKHDVQPLTDNWDLLLQTQPKSFIYNGDPSNTENIGYIAEDFDALGLKDLVQYDSQGRPSGINYDRISLYDTEILKQQQQDINSLKLLAGLSIDGTTSPSTISGVSGVFNSTNSLITAAGQLLQTIGITIQNGVTYIANLAVDHLTVKTASVTGGIEMTDKVTGQVYCTWIQNGQWQKAAGNCATVFANLPPITQTTSPSTISAGPDTSTTLQTTPSVDQTIEQTTSPSSTITQDQAQQVVDQVQQAAQQAQQAAQQATQAAQQAQQSAQDIQTLPDISQTTTPSDSTTDNTSVAPSTDNSSTDNSSSTDTTTDPGALIQSASSSLLNGVYNLLRYFFSTSFFELQKINTNKISSSLSNSINQSSGAEKENINMESQAAINNIQLFKTCLVLPIQDAWNFIILKLNIN